MRTTTPSREADGKTRPRGRSGHGVLCSKVSFNVRWCHQRPGSVVVDVDELTHAVELPQISPRPALEWTVNDDDLIGVGCGHSMSSRRFDQSARISQVTEDVDAVPLVGGRIDDREAELEVAHPGVPVEVALSLLGPAGR